MTHTGRAGGRAVGASDRPSLLLIDGSAYLFRAFHALPPLSDSRGRPTGAVYGFTTMLQKLLREWDPAAIGVAFDPPGPTERHALFEAYKANRPEMPDALAVQVPLVHRVVEGFRIPLLIAAGHEADDLLGSLGLRAVEEGYAVTLVTVDKDMLQLVRPGLSVYDSMRDRTYGPAEGRERYGVPPERMVDLMALMGDAIDNIPGVKGIGEKTARALLEAHGTLDDLLARPEAVERPKLRQLLTEQAEAARLSRRLATIRTDLDLAVRPDDLRRRGPDREALRALFRELDFTRLAAGFGDGEPEDRADATAAQPLADPPAGPAARRPAPPDRPPGEPLAFHENAVLFGHDATPGIVAVETEGGDRVRVYRKVGGHLTSEVHPFTSFLLVESPDLLAGLPVGGDVEALKGEAAFRYLVRFSAWADLLAARAHLQQVTGKAPTAPDAPYLFLADPVHQHLLLSGQTHFFELEFTDLVRFQLDIETYCTAGFDFPKATREGDRITVIAMADSLGWEEVLSGRDLDERAMLEALVERIRARDPDVIEGHNLFRFDLEYLEARARRHGVALAFGRDGSLLAGHPSRLQVAERSITYTKYEIHGRHIVDTWILAQHYDVASRELEGYGLKAVARHFGLTTEDRTEIAGHETSWYFDHDPATLARYALDDVRETRALAALLGQSYFVQAQIFPFSYQNVVLRGNASKIDALFLREYVRQRRAIPRPAPGREVAGGYTDLGFQGVARHVLHADVTSLYPSVMLAYGCFPRTDELGVFPALLADLKDFRVRAKRLAREAPTEAARAYAEALQATFKILINSFYGYLGFSMGHFNDFEQANRVTATGRALIQQVMQWLEARGCRILEIDTDGLYFVPPEDARGPEAEERLMEALSATLPAGIHLELDGRYRAMLSYKVKNYALLGDDGRLAVTGSGLRSRGLELFQRRWMEEMFRLVLSDRGAEVPALVERYRQAFLRHEVPVGMFMKTETLQDSLDTYRDKVRGKQRNPAAPYELALRAERPYQPGDQVSYYVSGTKKNVKVHEACKLASAWDPAHPDENTEYYLAKLLDLYAKFRPIIASELPGDGGRGPGGGGQGEERGTRQPALFSDPES